jgi:hypothetical protein
VWWKFSKNILVTNPTYIYIEINNKNQQKIATKLEPGKN